MPRKGNIIPLQPLQRIMLEQGAKRVSKNALELLSQELEEYALSISKKAIVVAKNSMRKTVKDKDIKAVKKIIE
jgi:histone H3/H4